MATIFSSARWNNISAVTNRLNMKHILKDHHWWHGYYSSALFDAKKILSILKEEQ